MSEKIKEALVRDIESIKMMIQNAKDQIVRLSKDDITFGEMEIRLNKEDFYIASEGGIINVVGHIIGELQMNIDDWTAEVEYMQKALRKLNLPVLGVDAVYNRAVEVCCPHCHHGTYIDLPEYVDSDSEFECGHCSSAFRVSNELISSYGDK